MKARAEARYRRGHREQPELLQSVEDIDALIDSLLTGPANENLAQIFSLERELMPSGAPDHELLVGVDRNLRVGLLAFMDAEGNVVTQGASDTRVDPAYCITGHRTEFPEHAEISIDQVREGAKEFLASGGQRPTCVPWKEA
jgi:hypothetical protein